MSFTYSRREVLGWVPIGVAGLLGAGYVRNASAQADDGGAVRDYFPRANPQNATETVLYAHSQIEKVAALVEAHPALANAAIDWGFGDWESAVGAAAHMGRRDVAELLLSHGARPDIFTLAMMGRVDAVRAIVEAQPGVQGISGPHGITLMAHAKAGKEKAAAVVEYLESIGGADPRPEPPPLLLDASAYAGSYRWGSHDDEVFAVEAKDGRLSLKPARGFGRGLVHVGDHAFYPGGAPAVRVVFAIDGDVAGECKIIDAEVMVSAQREMG